MNIANSRSQEPINFNFSKDHLTLEVESNNEVISRTLEKLTAYSPESAIWFRCVNVAGSWGLESITPGLSHNISTKHTEVCEKMEGYE